MAGLIRGHAFPPPSEQQGFLLPLALMCTLLLLLSGTSLQLAEAVIAQRVHLGGRILSVDTALTTVLAQALPS